MKRDLKALQQRRLKAARLLGKGVAQAEVARRVGASRQAVSRWAAKLEAEGQAALKSRPLGRPASLGTAERRALVRLLKQGALAAGYPTEVWTLPRVGQLIAQHFGVRFSDVHVSRVLKSLGFSCQRPTGRATQRDETAIRDWKQKRWPELKKTPPDRDEPSSSSTSRD